jgi:hypothetical protein
MRSLIFICSFLFCISPCLFAQKDTAETNNEKVYYFIDADCENCSVTNHINSKIWVVTNGTYTANVDDHEMLLKKFKNALADKYKADSALIGRAVFRFQNTEKEISESYVVKEAKMTERGYALLKIEF